MLSPGKNKPLRSADAPSISCQRWVKLLHEAIEAIAFTFFQVKEGKKNNPKTVWSLEYLLFKAQQCSFGGGVPV